MSLRTMVDRIDFALQPGVVLVAVFFFVLANVLLAAVLYPYFRREDGTTGGDGASPDAEMTPMVGRAEKEPVDERIDEFLDDIHEGREP